MIELGAPRASALKGRNELVLNQATMREAIGYWLRGTVLAAGGTPIVDGVRMKVEGGTTVFVVELLEGGAK